jgi:hypothetical protein
VVVVGGVSVAASSSGPTPDAAATGEAWVPSFAGSVRAPTEPAGREVPDDQGRARLRELATVTRQQAEEAALGVVPGTVAGTELDEVSASVVYSVEVTGSDGTVTDVIVDAGTAEVLARRARDADG